MNNEIQGTPHRCGYPKGESHESGSQDTTYMQLRQGQLRTKVLVVGCGHSEVVVYLSVEPWH